VFEILRAVVEAEIVAQEGIRQGLQYDTQVLRDVALWMNYWTSHWMEFAVTDTVKTREDEALFSLWRREKALVESTYSVQVQEILRPDSTSAAQALKELLQGADMDSLARRMTIRNEWRDRGGRSEWLRCDQYPEMTSRTMTVAIGETRGPFLMREGYAVLRLVGRRCDGSKELLDSLLRRERKRVRIMHQQRAIDRHVAQLALRHSVEIFSERISKADVPDVNMLTRRLIGFGGRINAAPILVPQWRWVEEWKQALRQLP
jgi:hypothetical protein